jgi:type I restriction enzyme, S subunit
MATDWEWVTLMDIADVKSGKRLPKGESLVSSITQFPYIRLVDVDGGRVKSTGLQYLTASVKEKIKRYIVNSGDVCLAIVGNSIGMVFYIDNKYENANLTENAARITNVSIDFDPKFLFYYFLSAKGQLDIESRIVGSAQGKLPLYNIRSMLVPKPPLELQKTIVQILGSLDDKIRTNLKMNQALESIAQTIFTSWFVDFDPVVAQMDGFEPEGIDAEIALLFPDALVESKLGMIPEGWQSTTMGSIVERKTDRVGDHQATVLSAMAKGELVDSDEHFSKQVYSKSIEKYLTVEKWDYAYNPSRINIGSVGMLDRDILGAVSPIYIVFRSRFYKWFVWFQLKRARIKTEIGNLCSGSVRQSLNYRDFSGIPIVVPPLHVFTCFESLWESYYRLIQLNIQENNTLGQLRDTLLPKLFSGEVQIPIEEKP